MINLNFKTSILSVLFLALVFFDSAPAQFTSQSQPLIPGKPAAERIQLVSDFSLSPDGDQLVFRWHGNLWVAPTVGGAATMITRDSADERQPCFSPDGAEIAFASNRKGGRAYQIFTMPAGGGAAVQRTFHSEGYSLIEYYGEGEFFLAAAQRDHGWRRPNRLFKVSKNHETADQLLFNADLRSGRLSPDGTQVLFSREGATWYRKKYQGSQSQQIWLYDLATQEYKDLLRDEVGFRYPRWFSDGTGFFYVGQQSGSFNLWSYKLGSGERQQITFFDDDTVFWPDVSRDGSTLVFRHLFDLYRLDLTGDAKPQRIDIFNTGEPVLKDTVRTTLKRASQAVFTDDGLEVAFISGGDLWVMDTELREPKQITRTPEFESEPLFSKDASTIVYISEAGGQCDIWRAERKDSEKYWWQSDEFRLEKLTDDAEVENDTNFTPDGRLAFTRGGGDIMLMDSDGKNVERLLEGWDQADYSFSPDGQWLAYAVQDDDFNSDVWILPVDKSRPAFNLSTHPDYDGNPRWSRDGTMLAFTGRRQGSERDIYYVYLQKQQDQEGGRDRLIKKAIEKMKKGRKPKKEEKAKKEVAEKAATQKEAAKNDDKKKVSDEVASKELPGPETKIDFDGLRDRIKRLSIPNSSERSLIWIGDRKLAFNARIDGKSGLYTVEFPDSLRPKLLTSTSLSYLMWVGGIGKLSALISGKPGLMTVGGKVSSFAFSVRQEYSSFDRHRAAFDLAWRLMRDNFYDPNLGNRNWDAVRRKYVEMATIASDGFDEVVSLMLGELNGSHLGFSAFGGSYSSSEPWVQTTAHLGCIYDGLHKGPGWKVSKVIENSPAASEESRLQVGDIILTIDGVAVDPSMPVDSVLNGDMARDIELKVRGTDGEEREVSLRPTTYGRMRAQLYHDWIGDSREVVAKLSESSLGYLHIRGMNWSSFLKFEEELYRVGAGKDGLIIDVRMNGGGSTADHLLTALLQPHHAITRPRGGGLGYPQGRRVYATWSKPIVVLCDQDSFSNAEIFAHAIKTLGRGQLVGVKTAGGVISTGGQMVMNLGFIRMPFRGWYLLDGEDMELHGAEPNYEIWPWPGDMFAGKDDQLTKAIEVLLLDVADWKAQPKVKLRKASDRHSQPVRGKSPVKF